MASNHNGDAHEPLDLSRLDPEARELWEEANAASSDTPDGPVILVWSFGYVCMLELGTVPGVVIEYLDEHDPENLVLQYLENVRAARREDRL